MKKQPFEQLLPLNPAAHLEPDAAVKTGRKLPVESWFESHALRHLPFRFGLAGFLWLNILLAIHLVGRAQKMQAYMPLVLMALATPVVFYSGLPLLRLAWIGLRERTLGAELLLSIAALTAYFLSAVQAFRGTSPVHFNTACMIVTFAVASKLIEAHASRTASHWVALLYRSIASRVCLVNKNQEPFIGVAELDPGQLFLVAAGQRFPTDGVVEDGESHADESLLTGELTPVLKVSGSAVIAGSLNLDEVLSVRCTRSASRSTLLRIIALVEKALGTRCELQRAVDGISRFAVPGVLVAALLTSAVCWLGNFTTPASALIRGITLLLIACPCALGLATPLAITAVLGAAARRGILVSDTSALELWDG